MEAATGVKPTRKQSRVLGLTKEGKSVKRIAKTMGISPNGVYAHIRALKKAGLLTQEGVTTTRGRSLPPADLPRKRGPGRPSKASLNGKAPTGTQIDVLVKDAIGKADDRVKVIESRLKEIGTAKAQLESEGFTLTEEADGLVARRAALATV